jgi:hypothetical protein
VEDLKLAAHRVAPGAVAVHAEPRHVRIRELRPFDTGVQVLRGEGLESWEEGINRYHLLERIADVMTLVEPDAEKRASTMHPRRARLECRWASCRVPGSGSKQSVLNVV